MPTPDAEELLRQHAGWDYRLARRMLGSARNAPDVSREVLPQVAREAQRLPVEAAMRTRLHRLTLAVAIALRRSRAARSGLLCKRKHHGR